MRLADPADRVLDPGGHRGAGALGRRAGATDPAAQAVGLGQRLDQGVPLGRDARAALDVGGRVGLGGRLLELAQPLPVGRPGLGVDDLAGVRRGGNAARRPPARSSAATAVPGRVSRACRSRRPLLSRSRTSRPPYPIVHTSPSRRKTWSGPPPTAACSGASPTAGDGRASRSMRATRAVAPSARACAMASARCAAAASRSPSTSASRARCRCTGPRTAAQMPSTTNSPAYGARAS